MLSAQLPILLSPILLPPDKDMPSSSSTSSPTSVFQALGSYADKMKKVNGNGSSTKTPIAETTKTGTTSSASKRTAPSPSNIQKATTTDGAVSPQQEEDNWMTVKSARQRPRQEKEKEERRGGGSNAKDWRDRGEKAEVKEKQDGDDKKPSSSRPNKKGQSTSTGPGEKSRPRTSTVPAASSKPAWGLSTPITTSKYASTPESVASSVLQTPKPSSHTNGSNGAASPPLTGTTATPSINGTPANVESLPPSLPSPNLSSADTALSTTANEEGSWRVRHKEKNEKAAEVAKVDEVLPAQPIQVAAPPPAVNVWGARMKTLAPAVSLHVGDVKKETPTQSGSADMESMPKPSVNTDGDAGVKGGKKKKKIAGDAVAPVLGDASLWPDVAQAAVKEEKKDKESKAEEGNGDENGAAGSKSRVTCS
jgi:la-related protein 1